LHITRDEVKDKLLQCFTLILLQNANNETQQSCPAKEYQLH